MRAYAKWRRALHALLAEIAVCAIVGCSKREDSRSTRPALTAGEVGTVTCDRLITYERACLKELLAPGGPFGSGRRGKGRRGDVSERAGRVAAAARVGVSYGERTDAVVHPRLSQQCRDNLGTRKIGNELLARACRSDVSLAVGRDFIRDG
ncbi:MAG TPA: hypothetical protein VGL17_00470 [Gemmatimonadaceae bacterium]